MAHFCSISGQTGNLRGQKGGSGPKRPESVTVFCQLVGRGPDVIAREIDALPTERREMDEEVVGNIFDLAQGR
jgi:hypothetical protein